MQIECNGILWTIIEKQCLSDDVDTIGLCDWTFKQILLASHQTENAKRRTLAHELAHAYLWSMGFSQNNEITYNYEQVADVVASAQDWIADILNRYFITKQERKVGEVYDK